MNQFIEINNYKIFAYHGYYDEEQKLGNWFNINLKIGLDFIKASKTDSIVDTLNYEKVFAVIKEQMQKVSRLLENVAIRISKNVLLLDTSISYLYFKIEKTLVPVADNIGSTAIVLEVSSKEDIEFLRSL